MEYLYIVRDGSTVRADSGSLAVFSKDEVHDKHLLLRLAPGRIVSIALCQGGRITPDAIILCFRHGISIAWLGGNGRLEASASPVRDLPGIRLRQFELLNDDKRRLGLAGSVIRAKILNGATSLANMKRGRSGKGVSGSVLHELRQLALRAEKSSSLPSLMGIEGAAARQYFSALSSCFSKGLRFHHRAAHPSPDPVNAMLSFGYTLLGNRIAGLLAAAGLEPCLGFLHKTTAGPGALPLDLLEEFRHPVVDRFVLYLCNMQIIRALHFKPDPERRGGMILTKEGLPVFFHEWEKWLRKPVTTGRQNHDWLDCLAGQVDKWVGMIRDSVTYAPFLYCE